MKNFPQIDLTITISVILALVSLLSPIIVTALNNYHQLKIKHLDFLYGQKFRVIEQYVNATGQYLAYSSPENYVAYNEAKGMVYLYTPTQLWATIDELDKIIFRPDKEKSEELFRIICKELSKSLEKANK